MSLIEHVWDALDHQCVLVPANILQLHTAIEEKRPQATINSLCKGDVSLCMMQMVVTPNTD
jgi:hypothetical protein